jgi:beta-glucanase (GH16 family)
LPNCSAGAGIPSRQYVARQRRRIDAGLQPAHHDFLGGNCSIVSSKRGEMGMTIKRSLAALVACACVALGAGAAAPTPGSARVAPAPAGWVLDWSDEFDGLALDRKKWAIETGGNGWGNQELEFYTGRPENLRVSGGNLVIEARREEYGGRHYTSARIRTAGLVERTYGRYEARIKVPRGQGVWPAFWLLGADIGKVGWPRCGEIDVMENIGREPNVVHGTLHGPGYSGAQGIGRAQVLDAGAYADDFHVFAVEWEPRVVRWYRDGILYQTVRPDNAKGAWVFEHPFYVLLNLAVGGTWPGAPDAKTSLPQQMLVDYVRVYRRGGSR